MRGEGAVILTFVAALVAPCAHSTCVGNSCPGQHAAASAHGLLGASKGCNRPGKTYPKDGSVKPWFFDTPIVDVRWAGNWSTDDRDKHIFALQRGQDFYIGGHLQHSDDSGKNWTDITADLAKASDAPDEEDAQGVLDIHFHPWQPRRILIQGPGYTYWVTEDFGDTYKAFKTPGDQTLGFWMEVKIHPRKPDWILSKVRRKDCLVDLTSKACAHDLFISQDFGTEWTNLTERAGGRIAAFWDFDWGASLTHTDPAKVIEDEVIFATVYEEASAMKGPYPGWDKDLHFVRSDDLFQTKHQKLIACGNQFEIVAHRVFLAMPNDCPVAPDGSTRSVPAGADERNSVAMYTSEDNAQTFKPACLPVKDLDLGYNLVTTHDYKAAFVIVDHDELDPTKARAPMSFVYSPGSDASMFALSLPRAYQTEHIADFARIEGLPGVYMANQLDSKVFDDPKAKPADVPWTNFLQTKVTFNGGGLWTDLQKPDTYNYPDDCDGCKGLDPAKCKLHLHGPTGWVEGTSARPSFYSHWNAPGIVMAVGNTGEYLDTAADATCTWLSRDGGLSWEDVATYAAIYEFGDHGSILLTAHYQSEDSTDEIKFSLDEGVCWNTIKLESALDVQNIRVEPQGASHVFIVHGSECRKRDGNTCSFDPQNHPTRKGMMYVLDIKELLQQSDDYQLCEAEDYKLWTPPGDGRCLLGRKLTLERQKQSSLCFNGVGYNRSYTNITSCPCSHDDFECDYGYQMRVDANTSYCHPMNNISPSDCEQIANGNWYQDNRHLRLLHNDTCEGVARVLADSDGKGTCVGPHCPNSSSGHKGRGTLAKFFIVLVIIGLCTTIGVWWLFFANDSVKSMVEDILAPVVAFLDSCWGWLQDKVSNLTGRQRQDAENAYFQPLSGGEGLALDEEDARSPPLFPMR